MAHLLHHLLSESARRYPERPAVTCHGRTLTYRELDQWSSDLASALRAHGLRRGDRAALFLAKSVESVVYVFGVLKAGGVYVPVDPQAPSSRVGYILANCGVRFLLSTLDKLAGLAPADLAGVPLTTIVVPGTPGKVNGRFSGIPIISLTDVSRVAEPLAWDEGIDADLAYILYTSGSTGQPKGVMLTHRHAMNFVAWAAASFAINAADRVANHAPLHFDLSILDIFAAIKAGATVLPVPEALSAFPFRLAEFIEHEGITVWYSAPSALILLLTRGGLERFAFARLRLILFAGEVFPTKYLRRLKAAIPHPEYYNLYGPTETNVCTFYHVVDLPPDRDDPIPIGRACANTEVFVLTAEGRPTGPDEEGELFVRGVSLMKGYWGEPERNARVLRQNPLCTAHEDTVYGTGDIVRRGKDGDYLFVGRRDNLVKSRGYRIELGEIETVLYRHADVLEAAAVALHDEEIGNRLLAVVAVSDPALDESELKRHCARFLPRYMVPETIAVRHTLPRTSTGKIDRQALTRALVGERG